MNRKRTNPDYLNGVPELLVLRLLSQRPMYGYQLVQAIRDSTKQVLEFGEGCIYPLLHKLERQKLLSSKRETVAGRKRVVYCVTKSGKARLTESTDSWQQVVEAVSLVLKGGPHGRPSMA